MPKSIRSCWLREHISNGLLLGWLRKGILLGRSRLCERALLLGRLRISQRVVLVLGLLFPLRCGLEFAVSHREQVLELFHVVLGVWFVTVVPTGTAHAANVRSGV